MNDDDLERRLRDALNAVAATTPDERPTTDRRPIAVATVAAVALAAAGVGAIVVVGGQDGSGDAVGSAPAGTADVTIPSGSPETAPTTASTPAGPTVLMPPADVVSEIAAATVFPTDPDQWSAALFAPTGEVFGVFVQPRVCPLSMGPTCGDVLDGSSRVVGANTVAGIPSAGDEAAAGSTLYMVHGQCASVTITAPSTLAAWDDVALAVLTSITMTSDDVTISLPVGDGWSSPGTGRGPTRYHIQFEATVDGVRSEYTLTEEPGGNIGSLFLGGDVTPSATNQYVFHIGSTTEEGEMRYAVVTSATDGTAIRLDGPGTPEQLSELAASLVSTSWGDVAVAAPPATTFAPTTTVPDPVGSASDNGGGCQPGLVIEADAIG